MRFKRRHSHTEPAINTASLPDIVFMLLFFFMVVTKLKKDDVKVLVSMPNASESIKLEQKHNGAYIHVGKPIDTVLYGSAYRVQVNDEFIDPSNLTHWIQEDMKRLPKSSVSNYAVALRADADVPMQLIIQIKQALRAANALQLIYSTQNARSTKLSL